MTWLRRRGPLTRFWPTVLIMAVWWGGVMALLDIFGVLGGGPKPIWSSLLGWGLAGLLFGLIWTALMVKVVRPKTPPEA